MLPLAKEGKEEQDGDDAAGGVEMENAQATLASVEEMLEGYEWASEGILGGKVMGGTADQIQARLLDELMALDKVSRGILHVVISHGNTTAMTNRQTSTLSLRPMTASTLFSSFLTRLCQSLTAWTVLLLRTRSISTYDSQSSIRRDVTDQAYMLQVVNDDIAFIQSQNRGLQVQTQNQRALLTELEELLVSVLNFDSHV